MANLAVKAPLGDGIARLLATLAGNWKHASDASFLAVHRAACFARSADGAAGRALPWLAIAISADALPRGLDPEIDALAPRRSLGRRSGQSSAALGVPLAMHSGRRSAGGKQERQRNSQFGRGYGADRWAFAQWPVAAVLFLAFTTVLAGTILTGRLSPPKR